MPLIVFLLLGNITLFSQFEIRTPLMMDSTNNKGEKFDMFSYLKVPSLISLSELGPNKLITLGENYSIESPKEASYSIDNYIYHLNVSGFEKVKINLYSNSPAKIGIDGTQVKERSTYSDSLNDNSKISYEKELEPGRYLISLSFLVSSENDNNEFRLEIEGGKEGEEAMAFTETTTGLTLKEMLGGRNINSTSISPSGKYILIKYFDMDNEGKREYGYSIADQNGIINSNSGSTQLNWIDKDVFFEDKGDELYYFDKVNENRKLIRQDIYGNKKTIAENLPEGSFRFLNNKRNFAILSQVEKVDNTKDDLRQYLLPDDRIPGWRDRSLLYIYDFTINTIHPLLYGYHSTYLNDYNPKTNSILVSVSRSNITERPFRKTSIYEIGLDNYTIDTLVEGDGFVSYSGYIPNTDKIIIKGSGEALNGIGNTLKKKVTPNPYHGLLFTMDLKTKETTCISKDFDPSISSFKIDSQGRVFMLAENKDSICLYKYSNGNIEMIDSKLDIVSGFDISHNGNTITYFGQNYNDFPKVFIKDNNNAKQIYQAKSKENLAIGEMKVWNFKYKGSEIEGRYYLPSDFDKTKKYPLVVYYYSGTTPTDRSFEMRYSAYLYTAQGYVVYVLNPSGTIGWGQEFASRHVNAWGERTADEIIYGVKEFTKQHSFIDASKIGCMGASYGGFMTQLLQTKTDIFACAVSHAGISDITSYWGEGYWGYSYSSGATAHSYPWNRRDIYVDRSPLFNADKINTPLLLLHGDSDTNVPIGESIQMFNALKILGKEVEFITVKGENHGIMDYKKRMKWNNTIYAWFAKHLKDQDSWWNSMYPKKDL